MENELNDTTSANSMDAASPLVTTAQPHTTEESKESSSSVTCDPIERIRERQKGFGNLRNIDGKVPKRKKNKKKSNKNKDALDCSTTIEYVPHDIKESEPVVLDDDIT